MGKMKDYLRQMRTTATTRAWYASQVDAEELGVPPMRGARPVNAYDDIPRSRERGDRYKDLRRGRPRQP